jgi:hypothetical protein
LVLAVDAEGNPFRADVIVVDSITPIQDTVKYGMIKTSEKRAKLRTSKKENVSQAEIFVAESTAGMEFKDYDKLQAKGKNLLRGLITKTNKYVCVISREKDLKKQVKSDTGDGFTSIKIGVTPDCPKDAEYEFFTVVHMMEDEDSGEIIGQIEQKDRTLQFERGEIIKNPSPLLWQPIIDGNKGKKSVLLMPDKYDDIIESEAEAMYSGKTSQTSSRKDTIVEDSKVDETDPNAVISQIKDIRNSLSPAKRQALSANFSKAGLPKQPTDELGIEVLVKMLGVAKAM